MAMQNVPNPITDVKDAAQSLMKQNNDGVFQQFGNQEVVGGPKEFLNTNTLVAKVVFILLILIIFIFLMRLAVTLLHKLFGPSENPVLIPERIAGTSQRFTTIPVDPNHEEGKPIMRSNNQDMGIEFTYSTWLYIKDSNFTTYKGGITKHIFHKGAIQKVGTNGFQSQNSPGLYLDGNENKLIVKMETFDTMNNTETVEIPDIPINKWLHVVIRVENRHLDVYVNGTIVVRHELLSVPKQNYSPVHVQLYNGFMGEQSSLRYFNRALTSLEIQRLVKTGPNMTGSGITSPFPPYLSTRWFFK